MKPNHTLFAVFALVLNMATIQAATATLDWEKFLSRLDMQWDKTPREWTEAPYLGNGMIGLMVFQEANQPRNVLSIHVGRGDYYDNRTSENAGHVWVNRSRLPIGFFKLQSQGEIKKVSWRLDLWNAELRGTVTTSRGSYELRSVVHSLYDTFTIETTPSSAESVSFSWQPLEAYSHARRSCEMMAQDKFRKGQEPDSFVKGFTSFAYPKAPEPTLITNAFGVVSRQELYGKSGEQITAWQLSQQNQTTRLVGTTHFSKLLGESVRAAERDLTRARGELAQGNYLGTHQQWWHDYYPLSFVSVSDPFWEQFYWIQMYKFAAATRSNGHLIDVMGPWYQPGFWAMVWTDLNVQLEYWTPLAANRLSVGESLPNHFDKYYTNLIENVPAAWRADSLNANTIFPNDMQAPVGKNVSDHIVWMLHDYYLHCVYADDQVRLKEKFYPLLKRAVNVYFHYLAENPLNLGDGKIHFKNTWSPEYPGGNGVDINYTLGLVRWSCATLIELSHRFDLHDPLEKQWQNLLDNLADYPTDAGGLRIGRDIPFKTPHRHYSHLLAFYPLAVLSPTTHAALLKTSLDHFIEVNEAGNPDGSSVFCGYTCTGTASMYALLNNGNQALRLLNMLPFRRVSSTTMYSEGNPVIESPFSAATSMHDMLLQSWDGRIRIFPAVPDAWKNVHFDKLRAQGGILVSAERQSGTNRFAILECSHKVKEIDFSVNLKTPSFFTRNGQAPLTPAFLRRNTEGFFHATLTPGIQLVALAEGETMDSCVPVKSQGETNIFGFNTRYQRTIRELQLQNGDSKANSANATPDLKRGLCGYWPCESFEGSQLPDSSGNGVNGVLSIQGKLVEGKYGNGLALDNGCAVDLGSGPMTQLSNTLTLSAWIRPSTVEGYPAIIGKGYEEAGCYSLHIRPDGHLWFELSNTEGKRIIYQPTDQKLTENEWAHVAATYDGTSLNVYINGEKVGSGIKVKNLQLRQNNTPFRIGWLGRNGYFRGVMDEVRLYNRALNDDEVFMLATANKQM